ncbi:hypothetical protein [Amycolatopsis saalfeldensis]|uniref:hypothetical protein n=1 Tax=Amycolatopsis saalfeldensis TaxID=394193 RepID=UPI001160601F|nr:hypothetical protein [Amycolatopsis saalfeldensis]
MSQTLQTAVTSAITAAVVAFMIDFFIKPITEARKERIVTNLKIRREMTAHLEFVINQHLAILAGTYDIGNRVREPIAEALEKFLKINEELQLIRRSLTTKQSSIAISKGESYVNNARLALLALEKYSSVLPLKDMPGAVGGPYVDHLNVMLQQLLTEALAVELVTRYSRMNIKQYRRAIHLASKPGPLDEYRKSDKGKSEEN